MPFLTSHCCSFDSGRRVDCYLICHQCKSVLSLITRLISTGCHLLNDGFQKRQNFQEFGVCVVCKPALDGNSILQLATNHIITHYHSSSNKQTCLVSFPVQYGSADNINTSHKPPGTRDYLPRLRASPPSTQCQIILPVSVACVHERLPRGRYTTME